MGGISTRGRVVTGAAALLLGLWTALPAAAQIASPGSQLRVHTETAPMKGRSESTYRYTVIDTIGPILSDALEMRSDRFQ